MSILLAKPYLEIIKKISTFTLINEEGINEVFKINIKKFNESFSVHEIEMLIAVTLHAIDF